MFNTFIATSLGLKSIERRTTNAVVFGVVYFICYGAITLGFFLTVAWLLGTPTVTILTHPMVTALFTFGYLTGIYPTYWGLCYAYSPQTTTWALAGLSAAYLMLQIYPVISLLCFVYIVFSAYILYEVYRGIALRLEKRHVKAFKTIMSTGLALFVGAFALYIYYCAFTLEVHCMGDLPELLNYPSRPKPT